MKMLKIKKIKPWYIILIILIIAIWVFFWFKNKKNLDWQNYQNSNYWISFEYPSNRETKSVQNTVFSAFSPIDSDKDIFQENINIVVSDNFWQPLDKFSAQQIDLLKKSSNFKDFVLESESDTKLWNINAYKIIYTWKINWYDMNLKWMQIWAVKWNTAYIFTYNWEETNFDKYMDKVNKILDTFKLK